MARDDHDVPLPPGSSPAERQSLMRVCSQATLAELSEAVERLAPLPVVEMARRPEIGLVMLRGRIGGDGQPFNAGEATMVRAVVRLDTGELGFSYLLGRSSERARLAAIIDALGQRDDYRDRIKAAFVAPVMQRVAAQKHLHRSETAATRVNFFTLVRGQE